MYQVEMVARVVMVEQAQLEILVVQAVEQDRVGELI
jgi:hypothetical protein